MEKSTAESHVADAFSPSLVHPEQYLADAQKIFPKIEAGKDGKTVELKFEEQEGENNE